MCMFTFILNWTSLRSHQGLFGIAQINYGSAVAGLRSFLPVLALFKLHHMCFVNG